MTVPYRRQVSAFSILEKRMGPSTPITAMIEIADRCNEVCVHCYQVQGEKGEMTTEQLKKVLDDLAAMGVLFLTISGGEATLRRDFLEIVAHARKLRFAVKLYTNGLTMTPELAARLAELAVQEVNISLYSHLAEIHDWVTRVPGSWQRTVGGARALIALGVKVVLKTPLMRFNVDGYSDYVAFVKSLGAEFTLDPVLNARENGELDPTSLRVDDASYVRVRNDPDLGGTRTVPGPVSLSARPCGACTHGIHIEANGEVRPCTLLPLSLGSALDGVRKAWVEGEAANDVRSLTWADMVGCRACELRPYCGRCFANARFESGDALGPYESACRRALLEYEVVHGRRPDVRGPRGGIGPFRELEPGVLETFDDELTDRDRELRDRMSWVTLPSAPEATPTPAVPGGLVQLRRPGRRPSIERIPLRSDAAE